MTMTYITSVFLKTGDKPSDPPGTEPKPPNPGGGGGSKLKM